MFQFIQSFFFYRTTSTDVCINIFFFLSFFNYISFFIILLFYIDYSHTLAHSHPPRIFLITSNHTLTFLTLVISVPRALLHICESIQSTVIISYCICICLAIARALEIRYCGLYFANDWVEERKKKKN